MKKTIKNLLLLVAISISFAGCKKDDPQPTTIEITVRDNIGNLVVDADVLLYTSESDLLTGQNALATKTTDVNGKVTFTNVSNQKYYYYASKGCYNNLNTGYTSSSSIVSNVNNQFSINVVETGTLTLKNKSSNPYDVYLNGYLYTTLAGGKSSVINDVEKGNYTVRVIQKSGYAFTPTDETYTGNVSCSTNLLVNFPE